MSVTSAELFIDRIKMDEEFAKKVCKCKDAEARMEFVKAEGYAFSKDELSGVSELLTDDELDNVQGGAMCNDLLSGIISLLLWRG